MSQITIQCRLVAPVATRQYFWHLMADRNTPLINELIHQVSQHDDFPTWRQKGKLPAIVISQLCQPLKSDPRFNGQPSRCYISAIHAVEYIFKSWLAIQKILQAKLDRKRFWLGILQSDVELTDTTGQPLEIIQARATKILEQVTHRSAATERTPYSLLLDRYRDAEDVLDRAAIAHLLKNRGALPTTPEDPDKFAQRRRKIAIQAQRLQDKIDARIPKGRDLTGERWLDTLTIATTTVPKDNTEAKHWQNLLLTNPKPVPFPLIYETTEDMVWSLNPQGRLSVQFNGLSEHTFNIYCDQRQLHWFQRFLEDQTTKRTSKNHSSALFTLRSGRLAWQVGDGKGDPWEIHHLTLYCTVDTRLWSAEGTDEVRQEKTTEVAKILTKMQEKGNLSNTQESYVKRLSSTLEKIQNPFDRPSQPRYPNNPQIVVGVSLGVDKLATLAVWDANSNQILAYRSIRQLLGDNYKLLSRQRQQQHTTAHERHKAQKRNAPKQPGTSNLGEYVDRLLAKAIIQTAKSYRASSIAVPNLSHIHDIITSEIQARAEQKCPGHLTVQKRYAKQYRVNIHRWSYGRLIDNLRSQASQIGIPVEKVKQLSQGTPQEKAKEIAIVAYRSRQQ
jgi:IS605 OrfB family transposase